MHNGAQRKTALYWTLMPQALQLWADHITRIVEGVGSNVVAFALKAGVGGHWIMPRWLVGLEGDALDVKAIASAARHLGCEVLWENDQPFLHCPTTDDLNDHEAVIDHAKKVLGQLNDLACLEFLDHGAVTHSGHTDRLQENGRRHIV